MKIMSFPITSRHLAIAIFGIGMWLLGALAILSAIFGAIFLGLLMSGRGDEGLHLFLLSFAMFLPGLAMLLALLTIFTPVRRVWKMLTCVSGLLMSFPAIILYVGSSGKEAILYLLPIIVLFLWSWSRLALGKDAETK